MKKELKVAQGRSVQEVKEGCIADEGVMKRNVREAGSHDSMDLSRMSGLRRR